MTSTAVAPIDTPAPPVPTTTNAAPTLMTSTLTLRDIGDEFLALDELAAMDDGEWTDVHEQIANELMERAALKADKFGSYVRELEHRADVIGAEVDRLAARKKRIASRVDWMKRYAVGVLERAGRPKIEGDLFTIALHKNPPSVEVTVLPDKLPADYVTVIPEQRKPNTAAILVALKAGIEIAGAALRPVSHHLRIR